MPDHTQQGGGGARQREALKAWNEIGHEVRNALDLGLGAMRDKESNQHPKPTSGFCGQLDRALVKARAAHSKSREALASTPSGAGQSERPLTLALLRVRQEIAELQVCVSDNEQLSELLRRAHQQIGLAGDLSRGASIPAIPPDEIYLSLTREEAEAEIDLCEKRVCEQINLFHEAVDAKDGTKAAWCRVAIDDAFTALRAALDAEETS